MEIQGITGLSPAGATPAPGLAPAGDSAGVGFGKLLDGLAEMEAQGAAALEGLAVASEGDLHDAVLAVEMESIAFELAVQVRNRLVDAYQEIFRMSV